MRTSTKAESSTAINLLSRERYVLSRFRLRQLPKSKRADSSSSCDAHSVRAIRSRQWSRPGSSVRSSGLRTSILPLLAPPAGSRVTRRVSPRRTEGSLATEPGRRKKRVGRIPVHEEDSREESGRAAGGNEREEGGQRSATKHRETRGCARRTREGDEKEIERKGRRRGDFSSESKEEKIRSPSHARGGGRRITEEETGGRGTATGDILKVDKAGEERDERRAG